MAAKATETPITDDVRDALDAAIVEINSMFVNAYDFTSSGHSRSPTGERFRDLLEGPYDESSMAIEQLVVWFTYCAKHADPGSSLYWQVKPEINHFSGKHGGYRIYCRYLISDKPKRD